MVNEGHYTQNLLATFFNATILVVGTTPLRDQEKFHVHIGIY